MTGKSRESRATTPEDAQKSSNQTTAEEIPNQELTDEQLEAVAGGITGPVSGGTQYTQVPY